MSFKIRPLTAIAFALGILGLAQAGRLAFDATNAQAAGESAKTAQAGGANKTDADNVGPPMCLPVDLAKEAGISAAEFRLLQSLQERRQTLDSRERDIVTRENLLKATDSRIGERMTALKGVEGNIQKLLGQVDELEAQRLASLVSVYEKMKPKDAARIMEGLETEVLLKIAQRMKAQPMALILANMSGERARLVTQRLAAIDSPDLTPMTSAPPPSAAPASTQAPAPTPKAAPATQRSAPPSPNAPKAAPAAPSAKNAAAQTPPAQTPTAQQASAASTLGATAPKTGPTGAGPNPPTPPSTPQPVAKAASGQAPNEASRPRAATNSQPKG